MRHIASVSFGKDSLAMADKGFDLYDEFVFYDTGKEFQAIYNLRDRFKERCERSGKIFTQLRPEMSFDYKMFDKPVVTKEERRCAFCKHEKQLSLSWSRCDNPESKYYQCHSEGTGKEALPEFKGCNKRELKSPTKHGYSWCGGTCRWGTTDKLTAIERYCKGHCEYVGIAVDESLRLEKERKGNKLFPLAEWDMTERDCLAYCYLQGYDWLEKTDSIYDVPEYIDLYEILDRVSCWCCRNKNLKELKAIYYYFTNSYWQQLKDIQARLPQPMKQSGSVFELEERFAKEVNQHDN